MSAWGASLRRVLTFTWAWLRFTDYYILQFLQANLEVFWEIVRPRPAMEPGLVAVPPTGSGKSSCRLRQLLTAARPTPASRAMSAAVTIAS